MGGRYVFIAFLFLDNFKWKTDSRNRYVGTDFCCACLCLRVEIYGAYLGKRKILLEAFFMGIQYIAILLKEIAVANLVVLKIVLSPKKKVHPVIVSFDAPLKNHILQAILADSITLTPGTITVRLYEEKFEVHCLDESMAEGINDSIFVKMLKKWEE